MNEGLAKEIAVIESLHTARAIQAGLKPCPWRCKTSLKLIGSDNGPLIVGWFVVCDQCGASQHMQNTRQEAIDAWNGRTEDAITTVDGESRHPAADTEEPKGDSAHEGL